MRSISMNDRGNLQHQYWYMEIMTALGYEPPKNGICYAIGHLGMNAGLLGKPEEFNARF
jgi:hypothetical protein